MEMIPEFNDSLSIDEIVSKINIIVKDNWISSYNYSVHNLENYKSKPLSNQIIDNQYFRFSSLYVNLLFNSLVQDVDLLEDKSVVEEVSNWDEKGALCIYLSVVLYTILIELKVCNRNTLRLIQGFTRYKPTNPIYSFISDNMTIVNFHAWLSHKGSVVDFSIGQEEQSINVLKEQYILGEIPNEIEYKGFKENHKTIEKYIEMFAKELNISIEQWKLLHIKNCLKASINSIELVQEKRKSNP